MTLSLFQKRVSDGARPSRATARNAAELVQSESHARQGGAEAYRHAGKEAPGKLLVQSDAFKEMPAPEAAQGGNAQAGHGLEQPLAQRGDVSGTGFLVAEPSLRAQFLGVIQRSPRADGVRAAGDELGHMHGFPRVAVFRNDPAQMTLARADKMIVQG